MTVHTEAKRTAPPTDDITVVPDAGDRPTTHAVRDPAYQGFLVLWLGFTVAPLLFGLDKFFDRMTDWGHYLAPWFADRSPFDVHTTMLVIGGVEIVAGLLVLVRPRLGGYVVARTVFARTEVTEGLAALAPHIPPISLSDRNSSTPSTAIRVATCLPAITIIRATIVSISAAVHFAERCVPSNSSEWAFIKPAGLSLMNWPVP